jgi:ADP-L-glycero-D-manno-heptose 6-epimerase
MPVAPAVVVHLAACTDTRERDRGYLEEINVRFPQRLWRICTERRIRLLFASSAATYGAGEHGFEDGEDALPSLRPLNEYGRSKHRFDLWASREAQAGRAPPAWAGLKFFNVYGFGERHKGAMASMVLQVFDQLRAAGRVRLFRSQRRQVADGEQRRDFIFVDDVVDCILQLGARDALAGFFNIGTGEARTFLDVVEETARALGVAPAVEFVDLPDDLRGSYQHETRAILSALRACGLRLPATSLEAGIAETVRRLLTFQGEHPPLSDVSRERIVRESTGTARG